jgi:hypothetical protein
MRLKIILPTAIVVLFVGLLSWIMVRQKVSSPTQDQTNASKTGVELGAAGAAGTLQLQLLRAELWLTENSTTDVLRDRLGNLALNDASRRGKATEALNDLKAQARAAKMIFPIAPDLAALVDKDGKAAGRSEDPQTYSGEDFGKSYPALMQAIKDGRSGSDIWLDVAFNHKHLVSYAPIREKDGSVLGVVVLAWNISDATIANLADGAAALLVGDDKGGDLKVRAKAHEDQAPGVIAELDSSRKEMSARAIANGAETVSDDAKHIVMSIASLPNVGNGKKAALAVARMSSPIAHPDDVVLPILAAMALGLVFVIISGGILGAYITEPVAKMEEGLLQVINGNTNVRIQLEHDELGGLAFRINQLLNTVLGVEEDNTDEEGRPSAPPAQNHFQEALSVDDGVRTDAGAAAALASEPEGQYYARLYKEYIDAKKSNGEAVEKITQDVFVNRIKGMEKDATAKFGKPVRYAVQRRDNNVVLLAIPLG